MINLSSAMGGQFAWSAAELTAEIRRIGPNPLKPAQVEISASPNEDSNHPPVHATQSMGKE